MKIIPTNAGEPQKVLIELHFTVNHTPGNEQHLDQVLTNYFRSKGVTYKDGTIIV